jgi:tRNA-specific 2-thiouridylase
MLHTADKLGCEYIATGHYARIDHSGSCSQLLKGVDKDKDQSYALWGITLEALSRTLLPIGELTKPEVREIAKKYGFINANRAESQDLCFVPAGDYAGVVRRYRNIDDPSLIPGPIYDMNGVQIGEHKGYAYYTIGQRQGLGISSPEPLYVTRINPADNSIVVAPKENLYCREFSFNEMNLLVDKENIPESVNVKIRYRHEGSAAHLEIENNERGRVIFENPERAITPGQSAVFYDGERVLGGGVIEEVID